MKKNFNLFFVLTTIFLLTLSFAIDENYTLGPSDELSILISSKSSSGRNTPIFEKSVYTTKISLNGYIELPEIGLMNVNNQSLKSLKDELISFYSKFCSDPEIIISLISAKKNPTPKVYILGAVKSPKAYDYDENALLLDYILAAGGVLDNAGDEIGIIASNKENESIKSTKLDPTLKIPATNIPITPGTIIYVPTGIVTNWDTLLKQHQNLNNPMKLNFSTTPIFKDSN